MNDSTRFGSAPPSSRRLPVAALTPLTAPRGAHVVLHVFCPRAVAATPLHECRDCPACVAFDDGEIAGGHPAVLCGW